MNLKLRNLTRTFHSLVGRSCCSLVSSYPERNLVKTLVFQAFWSEGLAIDMNFAANKSFKNQK